MRVWLPLLGLLLLLTKPDGGRIWIVDTQVVAVFALPGVGAASTLVTTLGGSFFVREAPEVVAEKLGWKP